MQNANIANIVKTLLPTVLILFSILQINFPLPKNIY